MIVDGTPDTMDSSNNRMSFVDHCGLPERLSERHLWQAKDAIQLLPSEKVIFENFVQRISLWVRLSHSTWILHCRTDKLIEPSSIRLIYLTQDAISQR